jgi:Tfp pilus assembly protein PilV
MSRSVCANRGIGLIESVIAILLVSIGLIALMSMQPSSWRASTRADYQGRAAMMLGSELASQELRIMSKGMFLNCIAAEQVTRNLYASGPEGTGQRGDISFSVSTTISSIGTNVWQVTVQVSWLSPSGTSSITESIVVTPQEPFRNPGGCI